MRKIHILKAIVDFVWFISVPAILILLVLIPGIFFIDITFLDFKMNNIHLTANNVVSKILIDFLALAYLLIIYSLFLFRKTLKFFLRSKIFDEVVIKSFSKIGTLLVISGLITLFISFIAIYLYSQKISFELGLNSNIIIICLGLFFMVLSEIFNIAKKTKQENDLTI